MKKEYAKSTFQKFDENMNPSGEVEEFIIVSLIPEKGKLIREKSTGIMGTRVDIGAGDSEDNYEEVDDPKYVEVMEALASEVNS